MAGISFLVLAGLFVLFSSTETSAAKVVNDDITDAKETSEDGESLPLAAALTLAPAKDLESQASPLIDASSTLVGLIVLAAERATTTLSVEEMAALDTEPSAAI
jgi:hypothetical protein